MLVAVCHQHSLYLSGTRHLLGTVYLLGTLHLLGTVYLLGTLRLLGTVYLLGTLRLLGTNGPTCSIGLLFISFQF